MYILNILINIVLIINVLFMNNKIEHYDFYEPGIRLLFVGQTLNAAWNHKQLSAPFWRFYWNEQIGNYIILEERKIDLSPDKIVLIPPNTPFYACTTAPAQHFYIHFVIKPPYDSINNKIFTFPVNTDLLNTIEECVKLIRADRYDSFKIIFLCHKLICAMLAQLPTKELKNPYTDIRVRKVAQYIDNNISRKLKNKDFAKLAAMHSGAINRLFKSQTGQTPLEYQKFQRIEKTCEFLQFSDKSIEQIADELGFYDRFHLSRVFKNVRDIGPAEYRNFIT
jgi:AraC-like DNA-binding protein